MVPVYKLDLVYCQVYERPSPVSVVGGYLWGNGVHPKTCPQRKEEAMGKSTKFVALDRHRDLITVALAGNRTPMEGYTGHRAAKTPREPCGPLAKAGWIFPVNLRNGHPAGSERRSQKTLEQEGPGSKSTTMNPPNSCCQAVHRMGSPLTRFRGPGQVKITSKSGQNQGACRQAFVERPIPDASNSPRTGIFHIRSSPEISAKVTAARSPLPIRPPPSFG